MSTNSQEMTKEGKICEFWDFYSCEFCPYVSRTAFMMCKHLNLHNTKSRTSETPVKYECETVEFKATVETPVKYDCETSEFKALPLRFVCDLKTPEPYKCKICEFKGNLKLSVKYHYPIAHQKKRFEASKLPGVSMCYQCGSCDFKTYSVLVLLKHFHGDCISERKKWYEYRFPIGGRFFECKECRYETQFIRHMRDHFIIEHTSEKWYKCEHNSFKTQDKCKFANADDNWFKCEQCSYRTKLECYLNSHMFLRHKNLSKIVWFKCEQCSFKTKHECSLKQHIAKHTSTEDGSRFKCAQCSVQMQAELPLNAPDLSKLKCEQCFKTAIRGRFKTHILCQNGDAQDSNDSEVDTTLLNLNTNAI